MSLCSSMNLKIFWRIQYHFRTSITVRKSNGHLRKDVYYLWHHTWAKILLTELSSVDTAHNALSIPSLNILLIYHYLLCKSHIPCKSFIILSLFFCGVFLFNYHSLFLVFPYCSFLFCFHSFLISIFNTDFWLISAYQYLILLPKCNKDQWLSHMLRWSYAKEKIKGQLLFAF